MAPTTASQRPSGAYCAVYFIASALLASQRASAQPQSGAPAAVFRLNSQHTGQSNYSGPTVGLLASWKLNATGNTEVSSAIGADGTIYLGDNNGWVYALDGSSGTTKWSYSTSNKSSIYATPALGNDGSVYIGSGNGQMYALNGATGTKIWNYSTGGPIHSSVVIGADNTIYFGSYDNYVYALVGSTGAEKWYYNAGNQIFSAPAIGIDGNIYVTTLGAYLYALNATSGALMWSYYVTYPIYSSPVIGPDGTVYFCANTNVYAVRGGSRVWNKAISGYSYSSPVLSSGYLYLGASSGYVYILRASSGVIFASISVYYDMSDSTGTMDSDGLLYIGAANGYLMIVDTNQYAVIAQYRGPYPNNVTAAPVIAADGSLMVGTVRYTQPTPSPTPSITQTSTSTPSNTRTPTPTRTPSNTPNPSPGAIQAVDVPSLIGSQNICGNTPVVPSWLYGIGLVPTPTPAPMPSGSSVRPYTSFQGMTATAQLAFQRDVASGALQSVSVTCQAYNFVSYLTNTQLLRYATASDTYNSSGSAYNTCSDYQQLVQEGIFVGYSTCSYYGRDPNTCTSNQYACTTVMPFTPSLASPPIPECSDGLGADVVPNAWQGYGSLVPTEIYSARFPADVFVMDGYSISMVSYGTNPLQEASPGSYGVGAATTYCIESATTTVIGNTPGLSLVIPALTTVSTNCVFASLVPTPGAVPVFYAGTMQGGQCIAQAGSLPLPWLLTSWTSVPLTPSSPVPAPAPATESLSSGATAAISSLASLAVVGAAIGFWMHRTGRSFKWPGRAGFGSTHANPLLVVSSDGEHTHTLLQSP